MNPMPQGTGPPRGPTARSGPDRRSSPGEFEGRATAEAHPAKILDPEENAPPAGIPPALDLERATVEFRDRLLVVARRILGSEDLAWEAVQDAFVTYWREPTAPSNVRGWLRRAVRNRSLHLARSLRRRRRHEAKASMTGDVSSDRDDPSRALAASEFHQRLMIALGRLESSHREVFILHVIEGRDYRAISQSLAIPIGTVRSRLSRARENLRRDLTELRAD